MGPKRQDRIRLIGPGPNAWRTVGSSAMAALLCLSLASSTPALASFHFMQIEQVIGGVNGDVTAQAIQLRMRGNGQNIVSKSRLLAWDAAGANPVVLIDFASDVPSGQLGKRVLVVSEDFAKYTDPVVAPDFILVNPIPSSYLSAGSITLENDDGTLLVWRLSWGGNDYTGATSGALTNDDDGEFAPAYPVALPTEGLTALQFLGLADAVSTNNADDYLLTTGPAVFTNNTGQAFTVTDSSCLAELGDDDDGDSICGDVDNCPDTPNFDQADADADGFGDVCDLCPVDPEKQDPGVCGCGVSDLDVDGNGTPDCEEDADTGATEEPTSDTGEPAPSGAFCGIGMIPVIPFLATMLLGLRLAGKSDRRTSS